MVPTQDSNSDYPSGHYFHIVGDGENGYCHYGLACNGHLTEGGKSLLLPLLRGTPVTAWIKIFPNSNYIHLIILHTHNTHSALLYSSSIILYNLFIASIQLHPLSIITHYTL